MLNDEILQLKSYDDKTGREISNVFPITNHEAVKVDNDMNLKEKLVEINKQIEQIDNESTSIDDTTISIEKTWSSAKIDDVVLTNVGAIWQEINGGQMMIDSTMDGFLRNVEILGNTVQNKDNLSDIQHVGIWNEEKQGYEIEICVSNSDNSDNSDDLNYQEFKTTILLPCQLMKIGNKCDRLYWDKRKKQYVIEKNITQQLIDSIYTAHGSYIGDNNYAYNINIDYSKDLSHSMSYAHGYIINGFKDIIYSYYSKNSDVWTFDKWGTLQLLIRFPREERFSTVKNTLSYLAENNICVYYQNKTPELIDTNITEELKLPTYINNTYILVNGGLQGTIKATAPIDGGKLINALQEENTELKVANNSQDELINTLMLATDTMYCLLEPLLTDILIDDKTINPLLSMYMLMVKKGIKNENDIPIRYKEQVNKLLSN